MSQPPPPPKLRVTLDHLVVINDEMASLARAGIPLSQGLLHVGGDLPGQLGKIAEHLGRRLESGQSLESAVSDSDLDFPPLYGVVVEAGVRSGRLSAALEGVSTTARRAAQLRRLIGLSLLYPLLVLALAYGLTIFAMSYYTPSMVAFYDDFGSSAGPIMRGLVAMGETAGYWAPWPPLLVLFAVIAWWIGSARALTVGVDGTNHWLGWLPTVGNFLFIGRMAMFTDLLALLIEQSVPLPRAITLSAAACGDRHLIADAQTLAEQIQQGQSPKRQRHSKRGVPPVLAWLMASGMQPSALVTALRNSADVYRKRAMRTADWLSIYLPILLSVGIGGTATIVYAMIVIVPWYRILYEIALP